MEKVSDAFAAAKTKRPVRAKGWDTGALHDFLLARARTPFAWGSNDCATFAADGILAMTGVDVAADFRRQYHDEASALAAIRAIAGGATIADAAAWCAEKHGLPEWQHPLCAQRGDLVVYDAGNGPQAGLVHLSGAHVVTPGDEGLRRIAIVREARILRAWHV